MPGHMPVRTSFQLIDCAVVTHVCVCVWSDGDYFEIIVDRSAIEGSTSPLYKGVERPLTGNGGTGSPDMDWWGGYS